MYNLQNRHHRRTVAVGAVTNGGLNDRVHRVHRALPCAGTLYCAFSVATIALPNTMPATKLNLNYAPVILGCVRACPAACAIPAAACASPHHHPSPSLPAFVVSMGLRGACMRALPPRYPPPFPACP